MKLQIPGQKRFILWIVFIVLGCLLWFFRSWNLENGDGAFCCNQTAGLAVYEVTLSRAPLSHLFYRALFFTLHPRLGWCVEDIIALSSCAAGLVYFWALYRLAWASYPYGFEKYLLILFCSSTMILQIFCGHIEFYSWTCALIMVSAYWAWKCIYHSISSALASWAMALAAAFHTSAIFYFPPLLLLPVFASLKDTQMSRIPKSDWFRMSALLGLFILFGWLHRIPTIYLTLVVIGIPIYIFLVSQQQENFFRRWHPVMLPWFLFYTIRAIAGLRAEPLLEHLPPLLEPYDHGAYLYMAFSWDHLYDKTMFHLWMAPFGLLTLIIFCLKKPARMATDYWMVFLLHFTAWTLLWTTLFYPQLRTRDWDLFASMAIPLNLLVIHAVLQYIKPKWSLTIASIMILVQLGITLPKISANFESWADRGYVTLRYEPKPVSCRAFLRGLDIGITPLIQSKIRSGKAEIRMIPLERGYASWSEDYDLRPGKEYLFNPVLHKEPLIKPNSDSPPVDNSSEDQEK